MIAAWIAGIGFGVLLFAGAVVHACRNWEPVDEVHTLDCRDWSARGITDPDCRAPHATDHFATPRDHAQFEEDMDWQIRIGEKK